MNLYEISVLEKQIERAAADNDGEISEEQLKALVEAQTASVVQIEKLCQYIRHLELGAEACKAEEERIRTMRNRADNRVASIKTYLTPYIEKHGKFEAGTFTLSLRKSSRLKLEDGISVPSEFVRVVESVSVDKDGMKKAIKAGAHIDGAYIEDHYSLQIK